MAHPSTAMMRKKDFLKMEMSILWAGTLLARCGSVGLDIEKGSGAMPMATFQSVQVDLGGGLRKIQCDGTGRMWFSTSEGVLYQDGDGFNRFTPADGLPHPAVKAMFQDRDHQYWFATWGGVGLYDTQISVFDLSTELSSNVSEVSQLVQDRRGDIWVGCVVYLLNPLNKSVFRFDGEDFAFAGN